MSFAGIGAILAVYSLAQLHLRADARTDFRSHRTPPGHHAGAARLVGRLPHLWIRGSFIGLFLSRAVHGACAATISTAQAYVADTTDEIESRARDGHDRRRVRTRIRASVRQSAECWGAPICASRILRRGADFRQSDFRRDAPARIASSRSRARASTRSVIVAPMRDLPRQLFTASPGAAVLASRSS